MQTLLSSRNGLWYANFTPSTPKLALAPNSPLTLTGPTPIPAPKNATPTTTTAVGIDSSAQGPGDSGLAPIDADTYEFDENLLSVSAIHESNTVIKPTQSSHPAFPRTSIHIHGLTNPISNYSLYFMDICNKT